MSGPRRYPNNKINVCGVLFDLEGTLLDTMEAYFHIMQSVCKELAWPAPDRELIRDVMIYRRNPIDLMFGANRDNNELEDLLKKTSAKYWPSLFHNHSQIVRHAPKTIEYLRNNGYLIGIVTDSSKEILYSLSNDINHQCMHTIVTSEDISDRKPSPEGLYKAINSLSISPEQLVYVGDSIVDMQAAKRAKMYAIGIATSPASNDSLYCNGADIVIGDIEELINYVSYIPPILGTKVTSGNKQSSIYLSIPHIHDSLVQLFGSTFYKATLNLKINNSLIGIREHIETKVIADSWYLSNQNRSCDALCYKVVIFSDKIGHMPGLVIRPLIDSYPDNIIEVIVKDNLHSKYQVNDNDIISLQFCC